MIRKNVDDQERTEYIVSVDWKKALDVDDTRKCPGIRRPSADRLQDRSTMRRQPNISTSSFVFRRETGDTAWRNDEVDARAPLGR